VGLFHAADGSLGDAHPAGEFDQMRAGPTDDWFRSQNRRAARLSSGEREAEHAE
jgi:hypothetical protein